MTQRWNRAAKATNNGGGDRQEADRPAEGTIVEASRPAVLTLLALAVTVAAMPVWAQERPPAPVDPDPLVAYDLSEEESENLRTYLPRAYAKLRARQPLHAVMIGDSVSNLSMGGTPHHQNWVRGYPYRFLDQLSEQFYYTGGVRLIRPHRPHPAKSLPLVGNEITLQMMSRGGRSAPYANQVMLVSAFEHEPDLVLLSFGINDGVGGLPLARYEQALREAVARARQAGAEPILLGPTLILNGWDGLASIRPYTMAMRNLAAQEQVWFADLGNLGWYIDAPPAEAAPGIRVEHAMLALRSWYQPNDLIHPAPFAHERIARRLFQELLGDRREPPARVTSARAVDVSGDGFRARLRIETHGETEGDLLLAPKATGLVFQPTESLIILSEADRGEDGAWLVELDYEFVAAREDASRRLIDFLDERRRPAVPLHLLVMDDHRCGLLDVAATIEPVAVRWDFTPVWNGSATVRLRAEMVAGRQGATGDYVARWLGGEARGSFELGGGEREIVTLEFEIEESMRRHGRVQAPLRIEFSTDQGDVVLEREVLAMRNLALGETFPLEPAQGGPAVGNVDLTVTADEAGLTLAFDLAVGELEATAENPNAVVVEVHLDARGFDQRQRPGATDGFRVEFGPVPGPGVVAGLLPWSFGTGYAMQYPEEGFSSSLARNDDGTHRVELSIPSSYLYLHEWAVGHADSQLGLNTRVSVLQVTEDLPGGGFPPGARWSLLNPLGLRADDSNLGRVELTDQPSGRWSVRLF